MYKDYEPNSDMFGLFVKWGCFSLAIVTILIVVAVPLGWFGFFAEKVGPANVQEQWRFAYDYDEDLRAIARQVCTAEEAVAGAQGGDERVQRESQLLAYSNNYDRVRGDYDARLRDAFRAGIIRPSDVPSRAPSLDAMKREEC